MIDYKNTLSTAYNTKILEKRMRFNKEYYHSDKKHVLNNFSHNRIGHLIHSCSD